MKKAILLTLAIAILLTTSLVLGKAGPAIPLPTLSITRATDLAKEKFYNNENRIIDPSYFKTEDYFLISAKYTDHYNDSYHDEWVWIIKFIHPVQNDHSLTYKVTNDKKVIYLYGTE